MESQALGPQPKGGTISRESGIELRHDAGGRHFVKVNHQGQLGPIATREMAGHVYTAALAAKKAAQSSAHSTPNIVAIMKATAVFHQLQHSIRTPNLPLAGDNPAAAAGQVQGHLHHQPAAQQHAAVLSSLRSAAADFVQHAKHGLVLPAVPANLRSSASLDASSEASFSLWHQ